MDILFKVLTDDGRIVGPFDLSQDPKYWIGLEDGKRIMYTGYLDKDGCPIYEGDKIRIYNEELNEDYSWVKNVVFHTDGFMAGDENLIRNVNFRCRVIGSIYNDI